jgi:hypothetical protein
MPEGLNVELAHKLSETEKSDHRQDRRSEIIEIVEVIMLAVVAIATAWSGFQAAKWDSRQALLYGQSSRRRFEAEDASTLGGQQLVADSGMFNSWLQARAAGNAELMNTFERRFSADYHAAFEAWLRTNPFTDPKAPPGPGFMVGFDNPSKVKAAELNAEASRKFDEGTDARENADTYVRDTVLFASVLFLIAMAQRLKRHGTKLALNIVAGTLLVFVVISVAILPRA